MEGRRYLDAWASIMESTTANVDGEGSKRNESKDDEAGHCEMTMRDAIKPRHHGTRFSKHNYTTSGVSLGGMDIDCCRADRPFTWTAHHSCDFDTGNAVLQCPSEESVGRKASSVLLRVCQHKSLSANTTSPLTLLTHSTGQLERQSQEWGSGLLEWWESMNESASF